MSNNNYNKLLSNKRNARFAACVVAFPIIIIVFLIVSYLHLNMFNNFIHHLSDEDNVMQVLAKTREEEAESWINGDAYGNKYEGVIYSVSFTNTGSTDISGWVAKITILEDCYLNSGWNGEVDIHQNVASGKEIVEHIALKDLVHNDIALDYIVASDARLVKLYKGDYIVYYPSEESLEKLIKPNGGDTTIGFIFYNTPGEFVDLSDIDVTYYKHKEFLFSTAFYVIIGVTALWVILLGHFAATTYVRNKRLTKAIIKINQDAAEKAISANREKTVFLSNMSHDIRTPMNAVIGFTRMAINHLDEPDRVRECLEKIDSASDHLLSLVNEVLDISHIESGRAEINLQAVDWHTILKNFKNMVQPQVESKNMTLNINIVKLDHRYVKMDLERFQRVLINLVANAVKYTDANGTVTVYLEEKKGTSPGYASYVVAVEDNGYGISKEFLPHLFDSFTREETEANSAIEGNGLGLAITKRTIELMKGNIMVESELGQGSKFTIEIPFEIVDQSDISDASTSLDMEDYKNIPKKFNKILLVEDNDINRELEEEILIELGFSVESAINGLEAYNTINNNPADSFDVILMDIRMPIMDGYEATRLIRDIKGDSKKANIPIFAMTADAFLSDYEKAISVGMNGHIKKPIELEDLVKVLAEL